jgi:hypothetical protein
MLEEKRRMQISVHEVLRNRLGNDLAIGNLSLIALNASGLTMSLGLLTWIKFAFLVSVPARIMSALVFSEPLVPWWTGPAALIKFSLSTLLFVYLQWVLIGWLTKKIAYAIKPPLS